MAKTKEESTTTTIDERDAARFNAFLAAAQDAEAALLEKQKAYATALQALQGQAAVIVAEYDGIDPVIDRIAADGTVTSKEASDAQKRLTMTEERRRQMREIRSRLAAREGQ